MIGAAVVLVLALLVGVAFATGLLPPEAKPGDTAAPGPTPTATAARTPRKIEPTARPPGVATAPMPAAVACANAPADLIAAIVPNAKSIGSPSPGQSQSCTWFGQLEGDPTRYRVLRLQYLAPGKERPSELLGLYKTLLHKKTWRKPSTSGQPDGAFEWGDRDSVVSPGIMTKLGEYQVVRLEIESYRMKAKNSFYGKERDDPKVLLESAWQIAQRLAPLGADQMKPSDARPDKFDTYTKIPANVCDVFSTKTIGRILGSTTKLKRQPAESASRVKCVTNPDPTGDPTDDGGDLEINMPALDEATANPLATELGSIGSHDFATISEVSALGEGLGEPGSAMLLAGTTFSVDEETPTELRVITLVRRGNLVFRVRYSPPGSKSEAEAKADAIEITKNVVTRFK